MKKQLLKKSTSDGISLIATVLTLMIFALFIAIAVSLVTTGSNIGLQEEQGMQALFVADGGLEYTIKRNNFPNFGISPAVNLGRGSFIISVPTLSSNITNAVTTINVSSTEGFIFNPGDPIRYWIMLCDTATNPTPDLDARSANCEKISFTNNTETSFTGGTRGRDSSTAATHLQNTVILMYSWDPNKTTTIATRRFNTTHSCNSAATTICVTSTANFASSGFIRINNGTENNREDVFYDGIGSGTGTCGTPCTACLGANYVALGGRNACIRKAYDGNGNGTVNHNAGTQIWQSEISVLPLSTGIIPGNVLTGDIQRQVQLSIVPLK